MVSQPGPPCTVGGGGVSDGQCGAWWKASGLRVMSPGAAAPSFANGEGWSRRQAFRYGSAVAAAAARVAVRRERGASPGDGEREDRRVPGGDPGSRRRSSRLNLYGGEP